MKRAALFVLVALLLLAGGLATLVFTEAGTRFIVARANQVEGIDIRLAGGSLSGQLRLESAILVFGEVRIELRDLLAQLDRACLWRSAVCFTELEASSLSISIAASGTDETVTEPAAAEFLRWPVRVEAPGLRIGASLVEWPGGSWHQGELLAGVTLYESTVEVEGARLHGATLSLPPSGDEPSGEALQMPEIFLPLDLRVNELAAQELTAAIAGVEEHISSLSLSGRWEARRLRLDEAVVSSDRGELSFAGKVRFIDQWPLSVRAVIDGVALGEYGKHEVSASLEGDLAHASLQATARGRFTASVDVDLDLLAPELPFTGGASLAPTGDTRLADLFPLPEWAAALALDAPLTAQVGGNLTRQHFVLQGKLLGTGYELLSLRTEGSHEGQLLRVDEMDIQDAASDSRLQASLSLDYSDDLAIAAHFDSPGLELPSLFPAVAGRVQGSGEIAARLAADAWYLRASGLSLEGQVNELPATLSGQLALQQGGALGQTRLKALVNGTALRLEGGDGSDIVLELDVDEFARWQDGARGGLKLAATRPAGGDRFELQGRLLAPSFGAFHAESGRISGFVVPEGRRFELVVDLLSPGAGGMELEALRLESGGSMDQHHLSLHSHGNLEGVISLVGSTTDSAWHGELAPTAVTTRHGQWSLEAPVSLDWAAAEGVLALQGHCWRHPQLSFCVGNSRLGSSGEVEITAQGDVAAFNGLVPPDLELQGALDAFMAVRWGDGEPLQLAGRGTSRDISITRDYGLGDKVTISWESLTTELQAGEDGVRIDTEMRRHGQRVMDLALQLPQDRGGEVAGTLVLRQMELNIIAPWAPELSRLEGVLDGELVISGRLDSPRFSGPLALTGGNLALEGNPTPLTDLELRLLLREERADINGRALLGGGELQIKGAALLARDWRLDLEIAGNRHQILVPPSIEMVVGEDLVIALVPGLLDVRGEIRVAEGVLRHEQLPAGSVALSPDVIEVDLRGEPVTEEDRWDVRSDVWIRIRDRFEVVGDSLNATVGGDLHLLQEPGQPPQLFGNLNILGGELRAYRQQLLVRRGTVSFSGSPDNPELDIRAEREIREAGVTVGAALQGSLEEPWLDVYSDPPMSQGDAMSYLVRGRPLDSGSGADGTALALAMGADVVNRSGILDPVNALPGLSQVALGATGSEEETAATVSGYIGERIYVSYGIGLYEPINVLTARLYLQSRLWLEVVSRLENSVDLYYSFDID